MDPTKIYKIKSYLTITRIMQVNEVGSLLIRPSPVKKFWTLDTSKVNEVGILLIRPFPVKKFWTLDTPKETGSIGSTLRRVETLWRSIVTCQDMVVREWIVFFETRGLQQEYIWSWLFLLSLQISFLCFESNLLQNSWNWLVIISRPIWALIRQCTRYTCNWTV